MKKKVRCENCDAVIDAEEKRFYLSGWRYHYRCYQCNSVRTVETSEPYRLPKWERGLTTGAVDFAICTCSTRPTHNTLQIDPACPVHPQNH